MAKTLELVRPADGNAGIANSCHLQRYHLLEGEHEVSGSEQELLGHFAVPVALVGNDGVELLVVAFAAAREPGA